MRQKLLCVSLLFLAAGILTGLGGLLLHDEYSQFRELNKWIDEVAKAYVQANDPKLWGAENAGYFESAKDKRLVIEYLISKLGPSTDGRASALILTRLFDLPYEATVYSDRDSTWWNRYQEGWQNWWRIKKGDVRWDQERKALLVVNDKLPNNPGLPGLLPKDVINPL